MRWLEKNTVLFGAPSMDGIGDSPDMSFGADYTLGQRIAAAFAKTFPATGYDHNTGEYYGNSVDYGRDVVRFGEEQTPYEDYKNFVRNPSLNNPAVSFFGATGLSGGWRALYIVKVPLTTLVNTVRLVTEFPLYVAESGFRHMLVQSKLRWQKRVNPPVGPLGRQHDDPNPSIGSKIGWGILSGIGIAVGAVGYYAFKAARLGVRLVTAPVDSAKSGWKINPALGIISGLLSAAAYVALAVFALPAALPVIGKIAGVQAVVAIVSKVITAVNGLFPGALATLTAATTSVGIILTRAAQGIRNFVHRSANEPKPVVIEEEVAKEEPKEKERVDDTQDAIAPLILGPPVQIAQTKKTVDPVVRQFPQQSDRATIIAMKQEGGPGHMASPRKGGFDTQDTIGIEKQSSGPIYGSTYDH